VKLRLLFLVFFLAIFGFYSAVADTLVWSGNVNSKGDSTPSIPMQNGETYYVKVMGSMYYGKWEVNGKGLNNDACYEYTAKGHADPLPVFNTFLNISVCDGRYRPDHVYFSVPFISGGEPASFWNFDTDYRDNSGRLFVELYHVDSRNDVMARNNCRCEDQDDNGLFGVVLNGHVLRSNVGSKSACMQLADSLAECRYRPDVMVPTTPVPNNGGGLVARIESQEPCKFASGGWAERRGHYYCNFKFSLINETGQDIDMTQGWSDVQEIVGDKVNHHRINYPKILRAGQTWGGHNRCVVPHDQQTGTIILGGAGHHRNNPDKQQFEWSLKLQCRP